MTTKMQSSAKPGMTASLRSSLLQRKCSCGGTPGPTGECEECRKKRLQRQIGNRQSTVEGERPVPSIVHEVIRSGGEPLDPITRAFMESRFGYDFGQVRVHTDAKANDSAQAVNADAYTVGRHLVFDSGRYAPGSESGRRLLAHELAHTIQQSEVSGHTPVGLSSPVHSAEHEAHAASEAVVTGKPSVMRRNVQPTVARQKASDELAPNPYTTPQSGTTPGTPSSTAPPTSSEKAPPQPPPRRTYLGFSRSGFGRFDADLDPDRMPLSGSNLFSCKLLINTKVKFVQDDSHGAWPKGRFEGWKKEFVDLIHKRWSTRYILVPAAKCPGEGCANAVVYVHVEPVTSGEHHVINVMYDKPSGARSSAGVAGSTPGAFYEEDVRPEWRRDYTTALHEAGHWFGLEHIRCKSGDFSCYGLTAGEADDVMGRGSFISARDYEPFLELMRVQTGCEWRTTPEIKRDVPSWAIGLGLIGLLGGAFLGGAFLGLGGAIGFGLLYGALLGGLGYVIDIS
jgi:hypothetical protein